MLINQHPYLDAQYIFVDDGLVKKLLWIFIETYSTIKQLISFVFYALIMFVNYHLEVGYLLWRGFYYYYYCSWNSKPTQLKGSNWNHVKEIQSCSRDCQCCSQEIWCFRVKSRQGQNVGGKKNKRDAKSLHMRLLLRGKRFGG